MSIEAIPGELDCLILLEKYKTPNHIILHSNLYQNLWNFYLKHNIKMKFYVRLKYRQYTKNPRQHIKNCVTYLLEEYRGKI